MLVVMSGCVYCRHRHMDMRTSSIIDTRIVGQLMMCSIDIFLIEVLLSQEVTAKYTLAQIGITEAVEECMAIFREHCEFHCSALRDVVVIESLS